MVYYWKATLIGIGAVLLSCSHIPSPPLRLASTDQLAAQYNWQRDVLSTPLFQITYYASNNIQPANLLTVYIEGDGFAWKTRSTPSSNPTPLNPVGLQLALAHSSQKGIDSNIVYLARPCQYTVGEIIPGCTQHDWTGGRFSPRAIQATSNALDMLKTKFKASQLQLVGYSGGGAVAALVAAQRKDIVQLVTVAGNLDHSQWTAANNLAPLSDSLNPADHWKALSPIPQIHFVGAKDNIIQPEISLAYSRRFHQPNKPIIVTLPTFNHHCCWAEQWSTIAAPYLID